jgi:hypothetical protein
MAAPGRRRVFVLATLAAAAAFAASTSAGTPAAPAVLPLPRPGTCILATGNACVPFIVGLEAPAGLALVFDHGDGGFGMLRLPGSGCLDISRGAGGDILFCLDGAAGGVVVLTPEDGGSRRIALPEFLGRPEHAVETDLDGDGVPEILLADFDAGFVAAAGQRPGSPVLLALPESLAKAAVAFDPDGDGDLDVAFCSCWRGTGMVENDGGFERAARILLDSRGMKDIQPLDFDLDGDCDLVAAACSEPVVLLLENRGLDGWHSTSVQLGAVPKAIAIADLDQDEFPDLVVACAGGNGAALEWLLNPGLSDRGGWRKCFAIPGSFTAVAVSGGLTGLVAACSIGPDGSGCLLTIYGDHRGELPVDAGSAPAHQMQHVHD